MAGGIITKLPPSLRDFATSLKHKRQEFSVAELIGSLDVEEWARAKDNRGKGVESSATNMVQKKNSFVFRHKKKKNMQENNNAKPKQTAQFKKKNNKGGGCFVCESDEHWASVCLDRKYKQEKKSANVVISELEEEHLDIVIIYLLFSQFVFHLSGGWTAVLIFMCVLMFLCLISGW